MNRKKLISLAGWLAVSLFAHAQKADPNLKLWYNKPATVWEEALPLGNAKTGAMVFGGIVTERFQLNDNTLWSGYPNDGNNADGPKVLPQVRAQIFAGNWDSATTLWRKMQGPYSARYLPLADLWIKNNLQDSVASAYYRDLDLNNATSMVRYTINRVTYQRETFISHPDQVMVIRITASKKGALNFNTALTSKLKYQTTIAASNYLVLKGKSPKFVANRDYESKQVEYDDWKGEGMNFEVHMKVVPENGTVRSTNNILSVTNADAVTIYVSEATSFNGFDKSPGLNGKDPSLEAKAHLQKAVGKGYVPIKKAHIADYAALFNRVQFDLGANPAALAQPTDERLKNFKQQHDDQLVVLYYQFGRYL
ncbi:MAG TPA: glycoside hydrolase family 95 protein, partial [Flavisolibacter sp.]|nr:glycoside hydrolase family 95 protein [Flavisolibacter sp.]